MRGCGPLRLALLASLLACADVRAAPLATVEVRAADTTHVAAFDGRVEAVRQTEIAAQISGAVLAIDVKAGDRVVAGQALMHIDSRAADQTATASEAQVQAGKAELDVATKELDRQRRLFELQIISQSGLDRAEAQFKSSQAQARAQIASASATRTQSGFYLIKAPYAGIIADVPAMPGDMALPGRPLLRLYDPTALRVTVPVPQSDVSALTENTKQSIKIEVPGATEASRWLAPTRVQLLPTVDPATHTVELWLDLPTSALALAPGLFARVWLPTAGVLPIASSGRLYVPAAALVHRAEVTGLYVLDDAGKPQLRQVRLGHRLNDDIEILSGVNAGEKVALDPDAAARFQ